MSRGRKPGFQMSEEHRVKIRNSNILNALIEHVEGKRDMSSTQVTAGLGLLRKCLPDLSSVEHSGTIDHRAVESLTDEEIYARLTELRDRTAAARADSTPPVDPSQLN
jgi:hypothetical protein